MNNKESRQKNRKQGFVLVDIYRASKELHRCTTVRDRFNYQLKGIITFRKILPKNTRIMDATKRLPNIAKLNKSDPFRQYFAFDASAEKDAQKRAMSFLEAYVEEQWTSFAWLNY